MFRSLHSKIVAIFLLVIVISTMTVMFFVNRKIYDAMVSSENKGAQNLLDAIVLNIEAEYEGILSYKERETSARKKKLQEIVTNAIHSLDSYYMMYENGLITEEQARHYALNEIQRLRFDEGSGYIWINDNTMPSPRMIMHPTNPSLNGRQLDDEAFNCTLDEGENLFRRAVEVCREKGSGYIEYRWPKPVGDGLTTEKPKVSYVCIYKKWDWIIGSGIYIDDIESTISELQNEMLEELRGALRDVRVAESGYVFVFNGKREMLVHPRFVGVDFNKIFNPISGNLILDDLMQAAHTPEKTLNYLWEKPPHHTGEFKFWKRAFVTYFEPYDWYIASSVYSADIEKPSRLITREIFYVTLVLLFIASCVAVVFAGSLTKPLKRLAEAAEKIKTDGIEKAEIPVTGTVETRTLGLILDEMIKSILGMVGEKEKLMQDLQQINESLNETNLKLAAEINGRSAVEDALQENRETYKSIVENSKDVIMLAFSNGSILYVSPACNAVLGYDPSELQDTLLPIAHPDDIEIARSIYKLMQDGKSGSDIEYRICTSDMSVKWISQSWTPIWQGDSIDFIVSIIRDITIRKNMEEDLINAKKLESIGILAGGIAHDFNNLLMAISGNIALALMDIGDKSPTSSNLRNAQKAASRASELSRQLLTFSKGGAPVRKIASISDVVMEAVNFTLNGSNVKCQFNIPDGLYPVEIDQGQVTQVINNLVLNALQAMPEGGNIEVTCSNMDDTEACGFSINTGKYVKVSIRDEGTGIASEHLERIFDPYFSTKEKCSIKGTGLGLTTVYSIMKRHNGHIAVDSIVGQGTTFTLYFPASEKSIEPQSDISHVVMGSGKVLVMDDEEIVKDVLVDTLERLGYSVTSVDNGNSALEVYNQELHSGTPFDVVIMDLTIPGGMGGKETVRRLKEIDPGVKAIVSSGYSDDPVMARYEEYGFKGSVHKPFDMEELSITLSSVMSSI
ncbi:MAG: cache domain-containing protein [Candidatus Auribacterota bacterium]